MRVTMDNNNVRRPANSPVQSRRGSPRNSHYPQYAQRRQYQLQTPQIISRISSGGHNNKLPPCFKTALINQSQLRNSGDHNNSNAQRQSNVNHSNAFKSMIRGVVRMTECRLCQMVPHGPLISITNKCNHKFCLNCLTQYCTYKINMNQEIVCPNQDCDQTIDQTSKFFNDLPEKLKAKYQVNKLWRQNVNNPNVRLCPRQQCKEGLVDLLATPPICRKCGRNFCKDCQMQAHYGPCQDNFQNMFTEWKRCPKCHIFIQKIDGCNHMICRCNHEFCYVCLANWTDQHYNCGNSDIQMDNYYHGNRWEQDNDFEVPNSSFAKYFCLIFHLLTLPILIVSLLITGLIAMILGGFIGLITSPYNFVKDANGCYILCIIPLLPCILLSGVAEGVQDGLQQLGLHTQGVVSKHCSRISQICSNI